MKETATAAIRVFPSTRKKLKILGAKNNDSLAEVVEKLLQ